MNRGSEEEGLLDDDPERASMRPRFMNRGSGVGRQVRRRSQEGFNEAPIHESGKSEEEALFEIFERSLQ